MKAQRVGIVVALLGLMGVSTLFGTRPQWEALLWPWTVEWAVSDEQNGQIARCDRMDWLGISRLVLQDIDHDCGMGWLPEQLEARLDDQQLDYLISLAADETKVYRTRLRSHLILEFLGQRQAGFSEMVYRGFGGADPDMISWFLNGNRPRHWMDPDLSSRLDVERWSEGFDDGRTGWLRQLEWQILRHPMATELTYRERLFSSAAEAMGIDRATFEPGIEIYKRAGGPPYLLPPLACEEHTDPSCLAWLAERLLEETEGHLGRRSFALETGPISSILATRFHGNGTAQSRRLELLEAYRGWLQGLPIEERASALVFWFGLRNPPYGPTGQNMSENVDPLARLLLGASSPWMTSLLWMELGPKLGLVVSVSETDKMTRVRVERTTLVLSPCGLQVARQPNTGQPLGPLTIDQVAARASLEWASQSLLEGSYEEARQHILMAEQRDPQVGRLARLRFDGVDWPQTPMEFSGCSTSFFFTQ